MLGALIDWALEEKWAVLLLTAAFVAAGLWAFHALPVEAFPDVTDTQVQVITLYPGHAPEEVERQVTSPIEKELNGTPRLGAMRSVSIFGLSVVTLTFADGTDDYFARSQVSERLRAADVPDGVTPGLGPLYTPIGEIYRYVLEADPRAGRSPMALREIQDWVLERQLRQVPGVADVVSFGGFQRQIQVEVDPVRLRGQGITLHQVFEALQRSNANAGGNYLRRGPQEMVIRGLGYLGSIDDVRNVVVTARAGTPLTVGDVARVSVGAVPRRGQVSRDAQDEVVEGIVLLRKGEDPAQVLDGIHRKVAELNAGVLPAGVRIVPYSDRTRLVHQTLRTVLRNLLEGALLVTAVVGLSLVSWRGALAVAAVIPLSILASFLYLEARHLSANLLSLGAVDFGIIVDGAVVIVENVFRRRQQAPGEPLAGVVRRAVHEVARPTLFSLGIIILAYLPIFTLQRVEGRMFAPMANTVASALVGALLFSLTLVPVLCALGLGGEKERLSPLVTFAERRYAPALRWALTNRRKVVAGAAAALAGALLLAATLGSEFLPALDEGALWVTATLPPSISLEEAQRMVPRIRGALREIPEVREVVAQLGRPEDGTDPAPVNSLQMFVDLAPEGTWKTATTKEVLVEAMAARLALFPGIAWNFSQPILDNVEEGISGLKGQVAVKVFGDDLAQLDDLAGRVARAISAVRGAADLAVQQAGQLPQVQIAIDRQKIARYGIAVADVDEAIETALGGKRATQLWEGERRFDVTVRFPPAYRAQLSAIRDVSVATPAGAPIPLSELAEVHVGRGRAAIDREANQRFVGIKMNVRGRDLGGFVAEAQAAVRRAVTLPPGFAITWGGEFENQQRAMARLAIVIPLSILLIFVMLLKAFGHLRAALLVLANIPFALIGGVVGLWITRTNLSVSAAVGFIALIGQAVLNGVLLLSDVEARRRAGAAVQEAVEAGALARLRAVVMTALLAALGLLPAALSRAIGAETQRPLAIVVIGGLVSATALTLFVLPVLYTMVEGRRAVRPPAPVGGAPPPSPGVAPARSTPARLSVAMIALDEADRIGRTLDAITCADEIVVVDGGSSDGTAEICRARGCKVVERRMDGFGSQRRFAVSQCTHDWVLSLDADEVMTPELNHEIRQVLARPSIREAAFRVEMRLVFLGRVFHAGRHAHEAHVRLFDRRRAAYNDLEVHEGVAARGPVGRLRARLYHHSFRDLHHFVHKMNDYTTRGARVLHARGKRRPAALALLSWPFYFLRSYLLQRNFLNGVPGLVWSFLFSLQPAVKYLKLGQLARRP